MGAITYGGINSAIQPCKKDCKDRCVGCATSCAKWAAYVQQREKEYARRLESYKINGAIQDGYRRLAEVK